MRQREKLPNNTNRGYQVHDSSADEDKSRMVDGGGGCRSKRNSKSVTFKDNLVEEAEIGAY